MKNTLKALWTMIKMMGAYLAAFLSEAIGIPGRLLTDISNALYGAYYTINESVYAKPMGENEIETDED